MSASSSRPAFSCFPLDPSDPGLQSESPSLDKHRPTRDHIPASPVGPPSLADTDSRFCQVVKHELCDGPRARRRRKRPALQEKTHVPAEKAAPEARFILQTPDLCTPQPIEGCVLISNSPTPADLLPRSCIRHALAGARRAPVLPQARRKQRNAPPHPGNERDSLYVRLPVTVCTDQPRRWTLGNITRHIPELENVRGTPCLNPETSFQRHDCVTNPQTNNSTHRRLHRSETYSQRPLLFSLPADGHRNDSRGARQQIPL